MSSSHPLLVVLTPVRNEAWILRAFLEATSLWADWIIVADQKSTDGSREIARSFSKVILVENDREEMHMAATRRLLFEESKKIVGDKIIFTLDADEFLSGDFVNTEDWQKILHSEPNDAFCWRWMNLSKNNPDEYSSHVHYYWAVHESEELWTGEFPDKFIHEWRLPWPPNAKSFNLDGFCSIHFARVNQLRQWNKERFYQVSTFARQSSSNPIRLSRYYHAEEHLEYYPVPKDAYSYYLRNGVDIWSLVDLKDEGQYYTDAILSYFRLQGIERFAVLDIWDPKWMDNNGIKDPRNGIQRALHKYLSFTCKISRKRGRSLFIRAIDKLLSIVFR